MKNLFSALSVVFVAVVLQSCCLFRAPLELRELQSVEHIVFVWLKKGYSPEDLQLVIRESQALAEIPGIQSMKVGKALPSERPIVDDSFQVGIVMSFDTVEAMREYLVHPEHVRRVKYTLKPMASKIVVYDILPQ